jgi:hypothetical protein
MTRCLPCCDCGCRRVAVFVTRCEKTLCNECVYGYAPGDDPTRGVTIHCGCPSPTLDHLRLIQFCPSMNHTPTPVV